MVRAVCPGSTAPIQATALDGAKPNAAYRGHWPTAPPIGAAGLKLESDQAKVRTKASRALGDCPWPGVALAYLDVHQR